MQQFRLSHDGWAKTQDSTANTINTLTVPAVAGLRHGIVNLTVCTSGAVTATALNIVIKDGATAVWKTTIPAASVVGSVFGDVFNYPLICVSNNSALSIVVDAGGAGCITTINAQGFTTIE